MAKFQDPLENDEPFQIPDKFIAQIDEVTGGNFILFHVNQEGEPCVVANFQNSIMELGLRSYVTTFVGSVNASEEIISTQERLMENGGHDEDCDFDDEDE